MSLSNDHDQRAANLRAALVRNRKSAAQRVDDARNFAELLAVNLDTMNPQQLAEKAASYRVAASLALRYLAEDPDPETHLPLLRLAGDYATHALTYEAALKDRGLA